MAIVHMYYGIWMIDRVIGEGLDSSATEQRESWSDHWNTSQSYTDPFNKNSTSNPLPNEGMHTMNFTFNSKTRQPNPCQQPGSVPISQLGRPGEPVMERTDSNAQP